MSEQQKLSRHIREGRFKHRESVADYIGASPTTILINMIIEFIGVMVLLFGVLYLVRFLFTYRLMMDDMHFRFFLIAVVFLAAGWSTHIAFKLRSYHKHYRIAKARKSEQDRHTEN